MGFPWGLDFGNQNCVIAIARKGGIDVIDNEASSRKTPCMVGLGSRERALGQAAIAKINSNIKNTAFELKRLIGRRFDEADLQEDLKTLPFKVAKAEDGGLLVNLMYEKDGGECELKAFTPEQLLAMLFVNLKGTAEAHNKAASPDCVVSVPCWFTDAQRRAVLDASNIAGLNVLRLLNETAATALCWGLPKTMDLPEDSATPKHVLFVDMGHSCTQVCLVGFTKGKMSVLASAFDRNLGGRDVDMKILNFFAAQWKEKKKLNLHESPKAVLRLLAAIDKTKQQLSGYTSAAKLPVNVECLQDDHDFSSSLSTDELTELMTDLLVRLLEPCKKVVTDAKFNFDQIDVIEVVGSATRSPLITNALKDHFGKEPQRTMNSEEAVSKGCALMGAMLSPNFKVRDFAVADCSPYPISLSWSPSPTAETMEVEEAGEAAATGKGNVVFTEHNVLPSTKMLTFMRSATFDISAAYADDAKLAPGTPSSIGVSSISVAAAASGEASKVKVKVRLDTNGILSVDSAQSVEEIEVEDAKVEPKVEAAPATNGDAPMDDVPPAGDGAAAEPPSAEPAGQPPAEEAKPAEPEKKKKKLKKQDLVVINKAAFQLPATTIDTFKNEEYEMSVQDRQIHELQERKNDLESYIYSMRDRVSCGDLKEYMAQSDKDLFLPKLDEMENWLYDEEAETANKSTFVSKLDELKKFGEPCASRLREEEERPDAFKELDKAVTEYGNLAATTDAAYEHIDAQARAKVTACVDEVKAWMATMIDAQATKTKTDPIVCSCKDIYTKTDHVVYTCRPIMTKPKPKPVVKDEPKPEAPAADAAPADGPAPGDGAADGAAADVPAADAAGAKEPDAMDVGLD